MSISSAAHTLLHVAGQSEASVANSTAAGAATAPEADSELSTPLPSATTTPRSTRSTKRVTWQEDLTEEPSQRPRRSTRGIAPKRLEDVVAAETLTPVRAAPKRRSSTQPPQPPAKRSAVGRKALSNAANTMGKRPGSNKVKVVEKQSSARTKPPVKPPAPKPTSQPSPPTRSTTLRSTVLASKGKQKKGNKKTVQPQKVQKTVVDREISSIREVIKFKLRFNTRWMNKTLSDDDTRICDTSTSWVDVMKLMDAPIHAFCALNNITGYLPYKIRAITTSTRSSRPKEVSAITLQHGSAEGWGRVLELIELNYSNGTKEHVVIIDSDWTTDGRAPLSLEALTQEPEASQSQGKRTQRSMNQSASYQADRGVFWNDIKSYWVCNDPLHCKVKARNGIACWIHKARHYEIGYNLALVWREALKQEGGSIRHPLKSIRRAIKDFDDLSTQRDARK